MRRLPPERAARTLIALRRPLGAYLRLQAAGTTTSPGDIALVVHVADRLAHWIAVSAGDVRIERF